MSTQQELLDRLEKDLRELLERVRSGFSGLDDDGVRARLNADKWNIGECFAHLNLFYEYYLTPIELAIHKAKARKWDAQTRFKSSFWGRIAARRVDPSRVKPRKTFKKANFMHEPVGAATVKAFIINTEILLRLLTAARKVNLNRMRLPFKPWGLFKVNVGDLFLYLTLHAQRHVAQAERMLPKP